MSVTQAGIFCCAAAAGVVVVMLSEMFGACASRAFRVLATCACPRIPRTDTFSEPAIVTYLSASGWNHRASPLPRWRTVCALVQNWHSAPQRARTRRASEFVSDRWLMLQTLLYVLPTWSRTYWHLPLRPCIQNRNSQTRKWTFYTQIGPLSTSFGPISARRVNGRKWKLPNFCAERL